MHLASSQGYGKNVKDLIISSQLSKPAEFKCSKMLGYDNRSTTRSAATYVVAKNVGKKNERNALQQALVYCRGKCLKKIDRFRVLIYEDYLCQKNGFPKSILHGIFPRPESSGNGTFIILERDNAHTCF
jgi:hypothetical protein